jgi:hypothetical protein
VKFAFVLNGLSEKINADVVFNGFVNCPLLLLLSALA